IPIFPVSGRIIRDDQWPPKDSDLQPDRSHEFQTIAFGNYALAQLIVKANFSIPEFVLEVNVMDLSLVLAANLSERKIVGADDSDGAALEQRPHQAFRANSAVCGVGALEELIQ